MNKRLILVLFTAFVLASSIEAQQNIFEIVNSGTPEQLQAALGAGADVNQTNSQGATPLLIAVGARNETEITSILIKAGADVNEKLPNGLSPIMIASALNQNPDVVKLLLSSGAKLDDRSNDGKTPLMYAAANNRNSEMISTLISLGVNVNDKDSRGITPLMLAAQYSNPDIIDILIKAGAKTSDTTTDGGVTPLMLAAQDNTNPEVIKRLIGAGANVNAQDNSGFTALMYAAYGNGTPQVVLALLDAGADATRKSNGGATALSLSKSNKQLEGTDVIQRLQQAPGVISAVTNGTQFVIQDKTLDDGMDGTGAKVDFTKDGEEIAGSVPMHNNKFILFGWGAVHRWIGKVTYEGYTFESDQNNPLTFTVEKDVGYVYLSGVGKVTFPDGRVFSLPPTTK